MAFDKAQIKDLDEIVVSALELFMKKSPPRIDFGFRKPLVLGSGNALAIGRILFQATEATFADESTFRQALGSHKDIDGAFLISASGGKHAPVIAKELKKRKVPAVLLTCNPEAPARKLVQQAFIFPGQPEPYTYNVSTYLGMILSMTQEDPERVLGHLKKLKIPQNLRDYDAFFLIVPEQFDLARPMFLKKFGELFGPMVSGRCFTSEQAKHGESVIVSDKEMFINFGEKNWLFGTKRLDIPMPKDPGYAAMIATGYYVIGRIQKQHPPYFRDSIEEYCRKASKMFGERIEPIVG